MRRISTLLAFSALAATTLLAQSSSPDLRVNGDRVNAHLADLAKIGATPEGGTNRVAYSDADKQGREFVMSLLRAAKLDVSVDAAGNIHGKRPGKDASLKPIAIGSHIDSVPQGGRFDGQVGSMGAIEVAERLAEAGQTLRHPLDVVIWQNEEGGTIGSHATAHAITATQLGLTTNSGKTMGDGIRFIGGDPTKLGQPLMNKGDLAGYLELHIEQGGTLDAQHLNIGVVEGIVGIRQWEVTIDGFANHAGTTPMDQRHDALLAAAKYIEAVNRVVTSVPGRQVGTVGRIQAQPGAFNVIPGRVLTTLELRDLDAAKIDGLFAKIQSEVATIEKSLGVTFTFKPFNTITPAPTDPAFRALIEQTAKRLGLTTKVMPSGAGHDAQEIAPLAPVGMIFIPSKAGISHSPKEFSSAADITNGANVLLQVLLALDAR